MSSLGSLVVSLSANTARFEAAMTKANYSAQQNTRAIVKEVHGMRASFDSIPGSIARIVTAAGGLYAVGSVLKAGIKAADEFKMEIIGIAAGITNIAKPGQGDIGQVFQRSAAFAKEMNKELMRVAAYSPAEPAEMMKGYNQLVQQGYVARLDEADALGVIVTRIKLATAGQVSNVQINQEIRSVMQGQAKDTSIVAMELQNRLGPGWKEIVASHKESGTLLKWWASLYPGITAASTEYQGTLEAQGTSLIGNLKYLSYEGMGGAYDYLVGKAQELNTYIQEHSKEISGNMQAAWDKIKLTIEAIGVVFSGVATVVQEIVRWIQVGWGALEGWRGSLSAIAKQRADMGTMMALDVAGGLGEGEAGFTGPGSAFGAQEAQLAQVKRNNESMAKAAADYKKQTYGLYLKDLGPPKTGLPPGAGAGGGGGGKGGGGADSIQKEIEKLNKEVDKARKDAMAAESDAFNMVWKLKKDTAEMYADATKGQYEIKGLYKDSYDTLASISPIMGDQIAYQKKALDLEMDIEKYTLKTKLEKLGINKAQEDELMGLQALTAQAKKFNKEMESDKGIRGWAYGRAKESESRNTIKDMVGGLESGFQSAFSSGLQGVLSQEKKTLKDIGKTMFTGLIGELHKGATTKLFDSAAKMLRPKAPIGIGGAGGTEDVASQLGTAAQGLQDASVGFNLNTAQFGLAAGGLLLSGIGIATNSQMLVYAGAVLQVAGLAIQLYEALTSTTTMTEMTFAAAALTTSAIALEVAADAIIFAAVSDTATSWIPFFHSGGPIYAHTGWPRLKSDEVPIIAQTGERVLSRRQNRDYEAGMAAGGGGGGGFSIGAIHIDARGASKDLDLKKAVRTQVVPELKRLAKLNRVRLG